MMREYSPEEISYLAASFAVSLADSLDTECIKVLCSFFVSVVGTLNLIAAQRGLREDCPGRPEKPPRSHPDPPGSGHRPVR